MTEKSLLIYIVFMASTTWIGLGVSILVLGLLMLFANKKYVEKYIRLVNESRGIATKITPYTLSVIRLMGVGFALIGLLVILFGWWVSTLPVIPRLQ